MLSLWRHIVTNDNRNQNIQENLEASILKYQKSLLTHNKQLVERCYQNVCRLYPPLLHSQEWWNQYHYLYDSHEDFEADYIRVFCNVLSKWKPRSKRKQSRYNGTGEFKNYFIGALQHNYINLVKADNAGKRNPQQKCPICETWVNPLSTHLLNNHKELMWDYLKEKKFIIEKLERCPFCKNHKMPRSYQCEESCKLQIDGGCEDCINKKRLEIIKKHLISKHSSLLFQKFNDLYPNHYTVSPRALSVYISDETDTEDNCYYDQMEDVKSIGDLYNIHITDLENKIIQKVLSTPVKKKHINVEFDAKLYKCSVEEFNNALNSLKNKLTILGFEG